ncbi:MAG: lipoprotein [Pseudomonadales bacterium]
MRALLLVILAGSVATCGQTGPLEPPPAPATTAGLR